MHVEQAQYFRAGILRKLSPSSTHGLRDTAPDLPAPHFIQDFSLVLFRCTACRSAAWSWWPLQFFKQQIKQNWRDHELVSPIQIFHLACASSRNAKVLERPTKSLLNSLYNFLASSANHFRKFTRHFGAGIISIAAVLKPRRRPTEESLFCYTFLNIVLENKDITMCLGFTIH